MRVMKNIKDLDIDIDVYAVAAVQEEVGCRGGKTTAYGINPDMAVAIDVCHGITPDNSDNAFEVGTGTVLSIGPNLHPKLTDELFAVSKRHGIKVSTDVDGGNTGTDAWEIQVACDGCGRRHLYQYRLNICTHQLKLWRFQMLKRQLIC